MRPSELRASDPLLQKLFNELRVVLTNISADNMHMQVLEGTTNSIADTKQLFTHGIGSVPSFWFPLEGDVYVPKNGFSENRVDVRSRLTSHQFKILVVK